MQYIAYEIMNLKIMMANFKRKLFISLSLSLSLSLCGSVFILCLIISGFLFYKLWPPMMRE